MNRLESLQLQKELAEVLAQIPSFSPETGIHLRRIATQLDAQLQAPTITPAVRDYLERYRAALELVVCVGGVHMQVVLDRLKALVEQESL